LLIFLILSYSIELEVESAVVHPTTVFVSKLPTNFTSDMLHGLFLSCGDIVEARVVVDKITGKSKRHGLVQFSNISSMAAAFAMNRKMVKNFSFISASLS
jgi:RNA recognition motif-containing protein